MNVKVKDLMIKQVVTTVPHKSVGHAKDIMTKNHIKSIPVVGPEDEVLGIITSMDLLDDLSENTPVSQVMTRDIYTVPMYADVYIAARMMRNHHIHHLVVTDEQKIVGVLSAFDLLALVEDKRFIMKNPPTPSKKSSKRN
jgi:signal-transduction protein with cAMP-binding, CBS, and nucleotidyltransferase domain